MADNELRLTSAAYSVMMGSSLCEARNHHDLILEAKAQAQAEIDAYVPVRGHGLTNGWVSLSSVTGDHRLGYLLRVSDDRFYLDIEIEALGVDPEWAYRAGKILLKGLPETICASHQRGIDDGILLATDLIDLPFLQGKKIVRMTLPTRNFPVATYTIEGHWSDGSLDSYPITMAEWRAAIDNLQQAA